MLGVRWTVLTALLVAVSGVELFTDGPWIVNGRERVRLKCVNWYGIHQEWFVAGGLETTSITNITRLIVKMNANCIRLPFSIEVVQLNPMLLEPQAVGPWIHDECHGNLTALHTMDCMVRILTSHGVMVILNNHNSWAGWVDGVTGVYQGLWAMPNSVSYGYSEWIACIETVAMRYAHNDMVVGFDLRNEIFDCYGASLTWGVSTDPTTDWKAAVAAADSVLERVNPRLLVIVGGMCMGYDLVSLLADPGPTSALMRRKLVYTTHVYTFSFWWEQVDNVVGIVPIAYALLIVGCMGLCAFARNLPLGEVQSQYMVCVLAGMYPYTIPFLVVTILWGYIFTSIGCSATARSDTLAMLSVACVGSIVTFSAVVYLYLSPGKGTTAKIMSFVSVWGLVFSAILMQKSATVHSYDTVRQELDKRWGTARTVPLWVGEFGAGWNTSSPEWLHILRYIHSNQLDFAYWALNGRKLNNNTYEDESFGLLDETYSHVRNEGLIAYVFGS